MKKFYVGQLIMGITTLAFFATAGFCADYSAEVMTVSGSASVISAEGQKTALKEGDILKVGSVVEVAKDSYLDLAYDNQWNNVTRISADSKVKIRSIYPTDLFMDKGDILAKLHKLPAQSTFEIETPTAVAAVRGSEYRTVYRDGVTDVYNLHTSNVEVYGKDPEGAMMREPVILRQDEKTGIDRLGEAPRMPEAVSQKEKNENHTLGENLNRAAEVHEEKGEVGKTQEIESVEKVYSGDLAARINSFRIADRGNDAAAGDPRGREDINAREGEAGFSDGLGGPRGQQEDENGPSGETRGPEPNRFSERSNDNVERLTDRPENNTNLERLADRSASDRVERIAERSGNTDRIERITERSANIERSAEHVVDRIDRRVQDINERTEHGQGRRDDRGSDGSGGSNKKKLAD